MVDATPLLSYRSATLAARAVARKKTGYEAWDGDEQAFAPAELQRWKRGETARRGTRTEKLTRSAASAVGGLDWDSGDPV